MFCYARTEAFTHPERLRELVEACYVDFSNRLTDMIRATTCECDACATMGDLGLKFVAHYGSFIVDRDEDGREDLAGADVIIVHRMLKNSIVEESGPVAYAFFSDECMTRFPAAIAMSRHREVFEPFGEREGGIYDLGEYALRLRHATRVRVLAADADISVRWEVAVPPAVAWQYFVDTDKRLRWQPNQTAITYAANPLGRTGVGASSHCVHGIGGDALREYLDWRPFDYFTNRFTPLGGDFPLLPPSIETYEFTPDGAGGSFIEWNVRAEDRSHEAMEIIDRAAAVIDAAASGPNWGRGLVRALQEDAAAFGQVDLSKPRLG